MTLCVCPLTEECVCGVRHPSWDHHDSRPDLPGERAGGVAGTVEPPGTAPVPASIRDVLARLRESRRG